MWIYKNKVLDKIPDDAVGFVYRITRKNLNEDISSPIYYIGKKNFYLKSGKKESNWKKYYGSSEWLKKHIEKYGEEIFEREILRICYSKIEMTYYETMLQITLDTLRVDKNSLMKKKYYNLNILGKFYKSKEFSKAEVKQISEYINTGAEEYQRIAVTDGINTKYINTIVEDIEPWLIENQGWEIGSSFKSYLKDKIQMTNGEDSCYVNKEDENNFLIDNPDWYRGSHVRGLMKCVNNGVIQKRIHVDELENFLNNNKDYVKGNINRGQNPMIQIFNNELNINMYIRKNDFIYYKDNGWKLQKGVPIGKYTWVNNNITDKKIDILNKEEYIKNGWKEGRVTSGNNNKISITNGKVNKYIKRDEDIPEDWYIGSTQNRSNIKKKCYVYHIETKEMKCILKEELNDFLLNNPLYACGKNYSTTEDKVFAINMETLEKVTVSKEEFKNSDVLTTMKTKQVKIKKKNRILFKGYLKIYLRDNKDIPERFFIEALKTETGIVKGKTKKYEWVEEANLSINYI